jgi:hypothetical protein
MAKRKKPDDEKAGNVIELRVGGGTAAPPETDDEEFADLDAAEEGQLSRAIEDVRRVEGAKAEVLKEIDARWAYCRTYAIAAFSHDRVASDFGAGKYRVRFKGPGDKYIRGGGGFDIAEAAGVAEAPGKPGGNGIRDLLDLIKADRERDREERERKKGDMFEWAKLLVPLLGPKLLELVGGGAKGPTLPELIRAVKDMKDLQAPAQDISAQFTQVMSVIQGAKDLVGDDGGGKTGSTWVDLLRDFIQSPAAGALAGAIPGMGMRPPGMPTQAFPPTTNATALAAPAISASGSASAPGPATDSQPVEPDVLQQLSWLRATTAQLLVQAQKQSNPRLYAEVVLDNLPDFIEPQALLERLGAETWWAQLQQLDARITPFAEWFQKFRDYAVRSLSRQQRKAQGNTETGQAEPPQAMGEGDDVGE